jgi:hypothetical protein
MLQAFGAWLENTAVSQYISVSTWAFPTIESLHVLFLVTVVGSIVIVDLRLLGLASADSRVTRLSVNVLPITWTAFLGALITGSLLFSSKASAYLANGPFRAKMILMAVAGVNMVVFHILTYRSVADWDDRRITPPPARIAGLLSLLFWIGIVACGRWIGFTVR